MTLQFSCRCGRQLEVPSDLRGRRVRCPACRAIVTAPETRIALETPVVVAAPPEPPPPATPLSAAAQTLAVAGMTLFAAAATYVAIRAPEAIFLLAAFAGLASIAVLLAGRQPPLLRNRRFDRT